LNPAGDHNEIWQHSGGCRAHLRVVRNTLTHEISSVTFARGNPAHRRATEKPS
jgi:heterotetrameric sarcosine oxidase delta subunit